MKKIQLDKTDFVLISIFLIVIMMCFLWCIDISVSCLINNGYLTNGFLIQNPSVMYHIGLYGTILDGVGMTFLLVYFILEGGNRK